MRYRWFYSLLLAIALPSQAQTTPVTEPQALQAPSLLADDAAPVTKRNLRLEDLAPGALELSGLSPARQLEFGVRGDRLVTRATLDLHYTPSPSLLEDVSHLKVYLNDDLMGSVPLSSTAAPGNAQRARLDLDPRLIGDFNRLRLELVGHYTDICEDPSHSSIWLAVGSDSTLTLDEQSLPLANDLARLPRPFFYPRDDAPLEVPFVVPTEPTLEMQRASGIIASWFGTHADWRGQHFPVTFDTAPRQHSVVLATNDRRPDFLADYPAVDGPTLELISHPESPYAKLLLVLGRDDDDLVEAARALALGDVLLRGQSASIEALDTLAPRQPYDAPAWIPTDRPVRFDELIDYPTQLHADGMEPTPLTLALRIPPDLFVWNDEQVDLELGYRYSPPSVDAGSRLDVSINGEYLQSFPLETDGGNAETDRFQVPLLQDWLGGQRRIDIPSLTLGALNQLRFDFAYANRAGGTSHDECSTVLPVAHQVSIDEQSTIDLSGFSHYLAMPALRTFANAGFPFSRLADLSQTLVVMPVAPSAGELSTLFDNLGRIGAQTGYPGVAVRLTDDWHAASDIDADILAIGSLPDTLEDPQPIVALGADARSRLRIADDAMTRDGLGTKGVQADSDVSVRAHGALAAILEMPSPYFDERSIVAMLAPQPADQRLLNATLNDPSRIARIHGSVSLIRDSGVNSQMVGERYYVGHLPWTTWLWYHLSAHPWLIAGVAVFAVLLVAFLLWRTLRRLGARRLAADRE
ncbi:cellulose biosynthesis cyclic di-GMP-binding regulatory protein BcsB [Halomonas sp. I1]|uniref:cellulose biosynthesis cyclic di-GMP-binding regulatory protein BcsB n=1 Tax=Halomonas sp. I1 TaxID=393536 RepID=UPI0028E06B14|nr:cellulose biosynthesis cyclic di-GMP-binding regulatory protein BcsB [Halomonas sp. I1]MDT8896324.1 cellulose biosynthesis cyclic di-GMP-binding regulatory protein BcsB [Halomonas sp. I1]